MVGKIFCEGKKRKQQLMFCQYLVSGTGEHDTEQQEKRVSLQHVSLAVG